MTPADFETVLFPQGFAKHDHAFFDELNPEKGRYVVNEDGSWQHLDADTNEVFASGKNSADLEDYLFS